MDVSTVVGRGSTVVLTITPVVEGAATVQGSRAR
ncbi:hypothetical protein J2S42_008235 [Catenuloplanes indicus]|uniref:Uncharacterized protein n=1 Tax=Catenuloplanes indicus TaxID=137267 RepID=A0AAE4B3A7_9ACTN|nr:hypothetical protein [Catenuloplanes indicus]